MNLKRLVQRSFFASTLVLALFASTETWADRCSTDFAKLLTPQNSSRVFAQDDFIQKVLGIKDASYVFFGQQSLDAEVYDQAVRSLASNEGLSIESIQRAHKRLTGGKARLGFRTAGDAKAIGNQSFKGRFALTRAEVEAVDANPFLTFVPAEDYKKVGPKELDISVGDIAFPSAANISKFDHLLSTETIQAIKRAKLKVGQDSDLHAVVLEDLLGWSLRDAEKQIEAGGKPPEVVLTMLEWRIRSLGLYYEPTFEKSGKHLVSDYESIGNNRSSELAEAIVDAFARKHSLVPKNSEGLARGFRPQLQDSLEIWQRYMGVALTGHGEKDFSRLLSGLKKAEAELSVEDRVTFQDYYQTRILAGIRLAGSTPEEFVSDFRKFKKVHYSNEIESTERTLLIPIEFIRRFGERPANLAEYQERFYHLDSTLFRGVSNPRAMNQGDYLDYFKSYKGRLASELSRTVFEDREELTKLAMLRFNVDLIEGRVGYEALQHANKHMAWDAPNSAKTYLVSLTDFNTVAFRFAADKGYVSGTSANKMGTAHFVMESFRPKGGAVDFGEFRKTDPNFRNLFPRQREVAIAGGVDPNSIKRLYQLAPYSPGEKIPSVGPEKHAKIVRIFERDENNPMLIWVLEKSDGQNWSRIRSVMLDPN
jgi:hypothetical protein